MPCCRHSSVIGISPRSPSRTIRIFSSAENFRRVLLLICFTTSVAMWFLLLVYATASIDTSTESVKFPSNCL